MLDITVNIPRSEYLKMSLMPGEYASQLATNSIASIFMAISELALLDAERIADETKGTVINCLAGLGERLTLALSEQLDAADTARIIAKEKN